MAQHVHSLLDSSAGLDWSIVNLHAENTLRLPGEGKWSIKTSLGVGGVSAGVQMVEICNGPLKFTVLPTRGMGIWQGDFRGLPLGWKSPNPRPVHPMYVNLTERNGLGWLNGFNELLCRCGLAFQGPPGNDNGDHLTLHGRIANLPATQVDVLIDDSGRGVLQLRGTVEETTFFGHNYRLTTTMTMDIGDHRIRIADQITNLGARPAPLSLLYHINVGEPFLEAGANVTVPSRDVVPRDIHSARLGADWCRYAGPVAGFPEEGYFCSAQGNADGWCTAYLANQAANAAFAIRFRTETLPYFTVWKNTMASAEGYVTGIEPGVNLPNFRAYERAHGRLPMLAGGETYGCDLELVVADTAEGVATLRDEAARCQGSVVQKIHPKPQPGWSPQGDDASP